MKMTDNFEAVPNKGAFTVSEFCGWAGIGVTKFYAEVKAGKIRLRKIGRKSVVTTTDALAWLNALPDTTEGGSHAE